MLSSFSESINLVKVDKYGCFTSIVANLFTFSGLGAGSVKT